MSDSTAEIKGAAARLAVVTVPMVRSCTGCIITDRAVILSQGPLAVCVGTMAAV